MNMANLLSPEILKRAIQCVKEIAEKYVREEQVFNESVGLLGGVLLSSKVRQAIEKLLKQFEEESKKKSSYLQSILDFLKEAVRKAEIFNGEKLPINIPELPKPWILGNTVIKKIEEGKIGVTSDADVEAALNKITKSGNNLVSIMDELTQKFRQNGLPQDVEEAINNVVKISNENIKESDQLQRKNIEEITKNAQEAWNGYKNNMKNIAMIK